jgi:hypothetical protein
VTEQQSLYELLMTIRYDLTAAQGKLTEALRQVDALKLEPRTAPAVAMNMTDPAVPLCPECFVGGGLHTDDCLQSSPEVKSLGVVS